jgi:ribosomal protein S18 acetylase RimI-like enzyme
MNIRPLIELDAPAYRELRLRGLLESPEAFGASYERATQQPIEWFEERIKTKPNGSFTLGAFEGGQLIGTVGFVRDDGDKFIHKGDIWGMYVAPEFRGRGVGRALMLNAIERARKIDGLEHISLGVMRTQTVARQLYVSLGFVAWGIEPNAVHVNDRFIDEEFMYLKLIKRGDL